MKYLQALEANCKKQLDSVSTMLGGYALSGGNVTNSTYSPTFNLQGANMTPAQATQAASKQYLIDRIRGLVK